MKVYKCPYCKDAKWTTRKEARKCIQIHIRSDKDKRPNKHPSRNKGDRFVSNITEKMLREDVNTI